MKNAHPKRDEAPLRPIGAAFAAIVAGLGPAHADRAAEARPHAPLEPASQSNSYAVDPTNHPCFEEDSSFIVEASEPVAPLANLPKRSR